MKYIRTKDRIFEVKKKERAYFEGQPWLYYCKWKYDAVEEKDVLNQADTIEELVDGYYVDIDNRHFESAEIHDRFESAKNSAKDWQSYSNRKELEYEIIVYAFIKTDKGLIYVAKMNDKGELELL